MSIGNMIKRLRKDELKLTQTEFGKKLGLTSTTIAKYESEDRAVSEQTIKSIIREFNVNRLWLETGKEPIFNKTDNVTAKIDRILAGENETAKAVFRAFADLSEDEWNIVGNIIDKLIEQKKADTD